MSKTKNPQLTKARDALATLAVRLKDFVAALQDVKAGTPAEPTMDAEGERVAFAVDAMASALCRLDALALPPVMKQFEPPLDEMLAYFVATGHIEDPEAPKVAASMIEYANWAVYGSRWRDVESLPDVQKYHQVLDAIDGLLTGLEQAS